MIATKREIGNHKEQTLFLTHFMVQGGFPLVNL